MKKVKGEALRAEYTRSDLGKGVRGKYAAAYHKGSNVVMLSPDVAKVFPDSEAVNNALRSLMSLARAIPVRRPVKPKAAD